MNGGRGQCAGSVPATKDWTKGAAAAAVAALRADDAVDRVVADLADDHLIERAARAALADGDAAFASFCRRLQKRLERIAKD